jgi:lipopolysaccharide biosynthesis glycosyltransferase
VAEQRFGRPARDMTKNNESAAVFACDGNYAPGVAITIMAIEKLSRDAFSRFVIFYDDWSADDLRAVQSISDKVTLVENARDDFLKRNGNVLNDEMLDFIGRWGHYKYIFSDVFSLLSEYRKIVFMDADLVIVSDIAQVLAYDSIAWRSGMAKIEHNGVMLDRPNAGLIVFNDSIPYRKLAADYLEYCRDAGGWDELALARLAHDNNIKTERLKHRFNVTPATVHRMKFANIAVFHCVGRDKIWNSERYDHIFPEYVNYLNQYCASKGVRSPKSFSRDKAVKEQVYLKHNVSTLEKMKKYIPEYIDVRYTSLFESRVRLRIKGKFNTGIHYSFNHNDDDSIRIRLQVPDPEKSLKIASDLEEMESPYEYAITADGSGVFFRDIRVSALRDASHMFSYFEKYIIERKRRWRSVSVASLFRVWTERGASSARTVARRSP